MSQDVNPNQAVLEDVESSAGSSMGSQQEAESFQAGSLDASGISVDYYADSLMDELFEDVNQILERGTKLPIEPAAPEFVSLQPVAMPRLVPMLMPRSEIALQEDAELEAQIEPPSQPTETSGNSLDRFLLVAVLASAIAAAASWLVFHFQPQPAPVAIAPSSADLNAQANAQFSDYLRRSLDTIDRRTAANRVASLPPGMPLPSVAVPGTTAPSPATVLERVYVPVYQPPQTLNPQISAAPAAPSPVAPAPIAPAAPIAAPAAARTAPAPVAAAPIVPHVLVGVMQLGERSAALFEVNGVTQRSYIGENIGTSGWTLVSVSNQEAVIRRNGEVRSIYVGQQL